MVTILKCWTLLFFLNLYWSLMRPGERNPVVQLIQVRWKNKLLLPQNGWRVNSQFYSIKTYCWIYVIREGTYYQQTLIYSKFKTVTLNSIHRIMRGFNVILWSNEYTKIYSWLICIESECQSDQTILLIYSWFPLVQTGAGKWLNDNYDIMTCLDRTRISWLATT